MIALKIFGKPCGRIYGKLPADYLWDDSYKWNSLIRDCSVRL